MIYAFMLLIIVTLSLNILNQILYRKTLKLHLRTYKSKKRRLNPIKPKIIDLEEDEYEDNPND